MDYAKHVYMGGGGDATAWSNNYASDVISHIELGEIFSRKFCQRFSFDEIFAKNVMSNFRHIHAERKKTVREKNENDQFVQL